MKNKRNRPIDAEIIKELFPEDEQFYQKIKKMTEGLNNTRKNSGSQTRYNSSSMSDRPERREREVIDVPEKKETPKQEENDKYKEIMDEKEIERKVEEFKNELLKQLNQAIEEEKKKENQRIEKYEKETNQDEKVKLEKEMACQRQEGNQKINEMQK